MFKLILSAVNRFSLIEWRKRESQVFAYIHGVLDTYMEMDGLSFTEKGTCSDC